MEEKCKVYQTAIYLRLSKEDSDPVEGESNSIINQKNYILEYVKTKPELFVTSIEIDDGYSGVDFSRPGFQNMMDNIKLGRINCVVVKDLSRFGRNYIEAGTYIEKIFPFLGIRFISINDNYDSEDERCRQDNILIPFKNLINDSYSRDISMKIRSHLQIKRNKGEFIGAFAPFGYKKSMENKHQLVPDEYAAGIVKKIYQWKLDGKSAGVIANTLNEIGIFSPFEYKKINGENYHTGFKKKYNGEWTALSVTRILKNEVYTGVLEQGKETTLSYKIRTRVQNPKKDWIRHENAHLPIITKEEYDRVQEMLLEDTRIGSRKDEIYLFSGILFCGECGEGMVRQIIHYKEKTYSYYVCNGYKRKQGCTSHRMKEEELKEAVLKTLLKTSDVFYQMRSIEDSFLANQKHQNNRALLTKTLELKEKERENYKERIRMLEEDYQRHLLEKADYEEIKEIYLQRIEKSQKESNRIMIDTDLYRKDSFAGGTVMDIKFIRYLINKIKIYDKKNILIEFRCGDNYERFVDLN